jgi:hypothetical protein
VIVDPWPQLEETPGSLVNQQIIITHITKPRRPIDATAAKTVRQHNPSHKQKKTPNNSAFLKSISFNV